MTASPPFAAAPAVRLDAVTVRRAGRVALDAIDLAVAPGEAVALVGPSGAGKTTLLSVLGAGLRPDAGQVSIAGTDPWALPARALRRLRATLFVAPQAPPLPPRQRVVSAVLAGRLGHWSLAHALASLWRPRADDATAAFDALARFDLGDKLWQRVDRLSGGERQRVSLARLVASDARLLLVDEPLSALDPTLAARALDALLDEARARGAALACSLHQVELALSRFPRVVGLRDGRVLFDRPSAAIGPADLARLYEGHEHERDTPGPRDPARPGAIPPGVPSAVPPIPPVRCG